jgi:hypothetical protein
MRKYPIGIQDFKEIRKGGYLYIDKTQLIHTLIESGKYYFLSRPRRFGKSLLLSVIKEVFQGDRDLFKGLWIEEHWDWNVRNPVIHLRLSQLPYKELGLEKALSQELDAVAGEMGLTLKGSYSKEKFRELIQKAAETAKVVILIDEYDKPVIDFLDELPKAKENRDIFKSFYSVLKDADEYIQFLMITGVSKFTQVSIFSDLNNLRDLTLSPPFATLTGITQGELETNFAEEIRELQQKDAAILQEIRNWYNGYSWDGENKVYNPFSVLNFMSDRRFRNYWFATGSPSFLVKELRKNKEFQFDELRLGELSLGNFDIERISAVPLLFQTGYLTIRSYDDRRRIYTLGYPNKEVEASLLDVLLSAYREVYPKDSFALTEDMEMALEAGDMSKVIMLLNDLISSIPYDHWKADVESIFHIIVHLTFRRIGVDLQSEVHSAHGRCDAIIQTAKYVYVLEFKLDGSAQEAVDQILKKGYLEPFRSDTRKKLAVGIDFSSRERKVKEFLVKET